MTEKGGNEMAIRNRNLEVGTRLVAALTHGDDEEYDTYLSRLLKTSGAALVKRCDIEDNLSRLHLLEANVRKRLVPFRCGDSFRSCRLCGGSDVHLVDERRPPRRRVRWPAVDHWRSASRSRRLPPCHRPKLDITMREIPHNHAMSFEQAVRPGAAAAILACPLRPPGARPYRRRSSRVSVPAPAPLG